MANRSCQTCTITSLWLLWVTDTHWQGASGIVQRKKSRQKVKTQLNLRELETSHTSGSLTAEIPLQITRSQSRSHVTPSQRLTPARSCERLSVAQPPLEEVRVPQREGVRRFPKLWETNYSLNYHKQTLHSLLTFYVFITEESPQSYWDSVLVKGVGGTQDISKFYLKTRGSQTSSHHF